MKRLLVLLTVVALLASATVVVLADPIQVGGTSFATSAFVPIQVGGTSIAAERIPPRLRARLARRNGGGLEAVTFSPIQVGGT